MIDVCHKFPGNERIYGCGRKSLDSKTSYIPSHPKFQESTGIHKPLGGTPGCPIKKNLDSMLLHRTWATVRRPSRGRMWGYTTRARPLHQPRTHLIGSSSLRWHVGIAMHLDRHGRWTTVNRTPTSCCLLHHCLPRDRRVLPRGTILRSGRTSCWTRLLPKDGGLRIHNCRVWKCVIPTPIIVNLKVKKTAAHQSVYH